MAPKRRPAAAGEVRDRGRRVRVRPAAVDAPAPAREELATGAWVEAGSVAATELTPGKKFQVEALYWDKTVKAAAELVGIALKAGQTENQLSSQWHLGRAATEMAYSRRRSSPSRTPLPRRMQQQSAERGSGPCQEASSFRARHSSMGPELEGGGRSRGPEEARGGVGQEGPRGQRKRGRSSRGRGREGSKFEREFKRLGFQQRKEKEEEKEEKQGLESRGQEGSEAAFQVHGFRPRCQHPEGGHEKSPQGYAEEEGRFRSYNRKQQRREQIYERGRRTVRRLPPNSEGCSERTRCPFLSDDPEHVEVLVDGARVAGGTARRSSTMNLSAIPQASACQPALSSAALSLQIN